jgi:hypothetical protein
MKFEDEKNYYLFNFKKQLCTFINIGMFIYCFFYIIEGFIFFACF